MGFFDNFLIGFKPNTKKEIYNFETVEQIESIPIPNYQHNKGISSPVGNIEYILQRKATEFKKSGRMDLAIACLKKANEIFPHSNFTWSKKDYLRLVEYLKDDNQFDMARKVENEIEEYFLNVLPINGVTSNRQKELAKKLGSDYILVENSESSVPCCEKCAKYRNRVYCISGKDKRFPVYSEEVETCCCVNTSCHILNATTLFDSKEKPVKNVIQYSNRPFVDERTSAEKKRYNDYKMHCAEKEKEEQEQREDKKEYDALREYLPNLAPKSFGGYRKMKNSKSDNFMKLVENAKVNGINIEVR